MEPAPRLHWDSAWPGWGLLPPGSPWGRTGARAPRAAHGSRLRLKASTATARGGAGGQSRNGRGAQGAQGDGGAWSPSMATHLMRSAAERSSAGVSGVRPPTLRMWPGSPAWGGGSPPRRCTSGALTGPPLAALTGRAASRAQRRWRHTAEPPGGRMGEARRSDRLSAVPSPRGASTWRRPPPVEAAAGGWSASTASSDLPPEGDRFYTPANHRLPCPSWPGSGGAWWLSSAGIPWQEPSQRGEMALWHW